MHDPSCENDTVGDAEFSGQLMQRGFLRAASGEQQSDIGPALAQQGEGLQQQMQALVKIK